MFGKFTGILLLILLLVFVAVMSSCAPKPKDKDSDEPQGGTEETSTDYEEATEVPQSELGLTEDGSTSTYDEGNTMNNENTPGDIHAGDPNKPFEPSQDEPLAPPVAPADGVGLAPEGQVSLVVNLDGGFGQLLLEDGMTVEFINEIMVNVTIVNKTPDTQTIVFPSSQKMDIVLTKSDGESVYTWSEGMRFAQVINDLTLEPGQTWSHEVGIYADRLETIDVPGTYNIKILMTGTPAVEASAASIEIKRASH